jgi:hypothetical protein
MRARAKLGTIRTSCRILCSFQAVPFPFVATPAMYPHGYSISDLILRHEASAPHATLRGYFDKSSSSNVFFGLQIRSWLFRKL